MTFSRHSNFHILTQMAAALCSRLCHLKDNDGT
jgi:hypothetical protein